MTHSAHGEDRYRWMILAIMSALCFMANFGEFQLAGVIGRLSSELRLSPTEFAMCLFAPYLMNFVFGIPVGVLADRFGARAVGSVLLIVACAALAGRTYASTGFASLLVWMLGFGCAMVFVNALGPKVLGAWFKPEHLAVAMGVFVACAGVGVGFGEGTASLFGSPTEAFAFAAVLFAGVTLWYLLAFKAKPSGEPAPPPQRVLAFLGVAARNRHVWLTGITVLFLFSALASTSGNMPGALARTQRVSPVAAGLLGIPLGLGGACGAFFLPRWLRHARGIRVWLAALVAVGAALLLAALVVPFGPMTWICVSVGAFLSNGMLPLTIPLPVMLEEIGTRYAGSAGGIVSLLQTAGGFVIPTFVIAAAAAASPIAAFGLIVILYLIAAALVLFLPERGFPRARAGVSTGQPASH